MKRLTFIGSVIVAAVVLFIIFNLLSTLKDRGPGEQKPAPTAQPTIPQGKTIEISDIPLNNVYKDALKIDNQRDVYFIDEPGKYQVVYFEKFKSFMISITGSPFEELRQEAEAAFLTKTGLSQTDACKLDVQISTPSFANPDYSGRSYPLSFCKQ